MPCLIMRWEIGLFLRIDFKDRLAFVGLFTISLYICSHGNICSYGWDVCDPQLSGNLDLLRQNQKRSSLPTYSHVPVHCQQSNIQHLCRCGKFVFRHILVWNIFKSCLKNGWCCIQNHICSGLKPNSLLL